MKQNQNTIAAIDHKRANSWPFLTQSFKKIGLCLEFILAVRDMR